MTEERTQNDMPPQAHTPGNAPSPAAETPLPAASAADATGMDAFFSASWAEADNAAGAKPESVADADAAAQATPRQDPPLGMPQPPRNDARPSGAPCAAPPCRADRLFNAAARLAPLALLLLLLLEVWPSLVSGNFYCPAETREVLVYRHTVADGHWLSPAGAGYAQWPGFFWLLRGVDAGLAHIAPALSRALFPVTALIGALLCLLAVHGLGRAAGLDRREALAGCLTMFCAPLFAPVAGFTGPQSLACALTLASLALLCRGWRRERAWLSLPAGYLLAALAGLTGGLFHLLLPVLVCPVFVFWRSGGRPRGRALDGLAGFVLLLLAVGAWLGFVILGGQSQDYLRLLGQRMAVWPPAADCWKPLAVAGLGLLPWLAAPLFASWVRAVKNAPRGLLDSRREGSGLAFLWIALTLSCGLNLLVPGGLAPLLCVLGLAAPLLGRMLLRLPPLGGRLLHLFAALLLATAGAVLLAAAFPAPLDALLALTGQSLAPAWRDALPGLTALPVLGGVCLLGAALALRHALARPSAGMGGALLRYAGLTVLLAQPAALLLAPQVADIPQARLLRLEAIAPPEAEGVAARPGAQAMPNDASAPQTAQPEATQPEKARPDSAHAQGPSSETPARQGPAAETDTPDAPDTAPSTQPGAARPGQGPTPAEKGASHDPADSVKETPSQTPTPQPPAEGASPDVPQPHVTEL